ncbi:DUF2752 domain-containing protein [Flavihumibacter fluvii]|uniref:DUF2752 domain-containing protein n=1 Tax=Flavihumibacter fluvii TaxID=2838157 RepID=UPI001BDF0847|nr:DUF2752 domain-containing protein [Flavihumibacter fluvii]
MIFRWIYRNNELLIWIAALLWIYFGINPAEKQTSFCTFHWLGFTVCPGCGIGRSMHAALHGQWGISWEYHWFGLPALLIIFFRVISLITTNKKHLHEQLPDGYARPAARGTGWH